MVHHQVCPLCTSDKIAIYLRCTDHFVSKEIFQIDKCGECGFEFTQDHPEEGEMGKYYESEDYISHTDTSKGFSNKLYKLARNFMLRRKVGIVRKVTGLNTGNLLDIGSGTGHFADIMKRNGWQVKGIEINEKARNFSISNFGLDAAGAEYFTILKPGSFDCITLWHVLEHFHDPFSYASGILHLLKPGGVCVIALPNSSSYDAKHYGRFWAAYDVPRHLWHFTPLTFKLFSEKTGFRSELLMRLPFDVYYISALSEKYKSTGLSFFSGMIKATIFTALSFFNKERSSSIVYLLRKSPG
jgi:SAM-dependent methyltransferase